MSIFKNVALPSETWTQIIGNLQSVNTEASMRQAGLIREQVDDELKVKVTSRTVRLSAKRGGDVRDSLLGS